MPSQNFADRLATELSQSQQPGFREAYESLRRIADGIRDALSRPAPGVAAAPPPVEVGLEPGYATSLGQQFRVRLRLPSRKWEETLFRAYIPPHGFPVSLDLDGERPVACSDEAALEQAVLGFMRKPEIATRLSIVTEPA